MQLRDLARQVTNGKLNELELDNVGSILLAVVSALESQEKRHLEELEQQEERHKVKIKELIDRIEDLEQRVCRIDPLVKKRPSRYNI